ncbi:hypothetical protein JP75_09575 [Devosia riboflavina]|uniref:HTH lysR-type domain-containing protein n=1 Tax=Devosia riboflavina TaxID=46914 RepID=A0A087M2P1_9HYPH|nr:LysR family transcriptional regulator [Devosia riboflavina]KFL31144.1 hypothetical protein JP75_09575 [Devosia riboflavina]
MQLDDIRAFLHMANSGSLSRTARDRGQPKATLSQRLRRLEDELGTPLVSRSGTGIALTKAGRAFVPHAEEVERACARAHDAVAGLRPSDKAELRIGVTEQLATNLVTPLALQFVRDHPGMLLDVQVMPASRLFLKEVNLDCMVCGGLPGIEDGADLVARGISQYRRRLYAAQDYLSRKRMPTGPDDLKDHELVCNASGIDKARWELCFEDKVFTLEPSGPIRTNDDWVAKVCVMQGQGISLFPDFFAQEHVKSGDLVEVLPGWATAPTSITVVHHAHRFANPYIRTFIDFFADRFDGFFCFPYRSGDVMNKQACR